MTDRHDARGGHRLFFALWPTDDLRTSLAEAADGVAAFDAGRPIAGAKLHLTLHFLGGWPGLPQDVLSAASCAAATVRARPFHLVIDRAGGFAAARVGWLAPAGNSGLDALWSQLGRALDEAGIERRPAPRFVPHVTVRRAMPSLAPAGSVPPISWPVDSFVLVHSREGRYDVLDRWALSAA
jgi:2'-5' RNA ligase